MKSLGFLTFVVAVLLAAGASLGAAPTSPANDSGGALHNVVADGGQWGSKGGKSLTG